MVACLKCLLLGKGSNFEAKTIFSGLKTIFSEKYIVSFYQENHKESEYNKIDVQKWTQKAPISNKTL